jgi:hypothetical protein
MQQHLHKSLNNKLVHAQGILSSEGGYGQTVKPASSNHIWAKNNWSSSLRLKGIATFGTGPKGGL